VTSAARRHAAIGRIWWRPDPGWGEGLLFAPLTGAEGLFRAGAALRGALYRWGVLPAVRASAPVVSVGNLAVGGAGKTPVVMAIAERLRAAGRKPAVLSRGYGGRATGARVVSDGAGPLLGSEEGGDEPVLLARRLPGLRVLCGRDRGELAKVAVATLGADVLLLDDGFQHRRLLRDLDVVVLDASNPWGNGHCLPRGPNREPAGALRRAGLVWLTHVDRAEEDRAEGLRELARRFTGSDPVESWHAPRDLVPASLQGSLGLPWLRGRRVGLLTGVARPESVRRTVEALGAEVALSRDFPDHHRFTDEEVEEALAAAERGGADGVVTTEKDAVRLSPAWAGEERLRVLRIEAEIVRGADVLDRALAEVLARSARPGGEGGP